MLMSLIKSWLNLMSNILWSLSHLQGIGSSIPVGSLLEKDTEVAYNQCPFPEFWGALCREG